MHDDDDTTWPHVDPVLVPCLQTVSRHCVQDGSAWNSCRLSTSCPRAGFQTTHTFDSTGDHGVLRVDDIGNPWTVYAGYVTWPSFPAQGAAGNVSPLHYYETENTAVAAVRKCGVYCPAYPT